MANWQLTEIFLGIMSSPRLKAAIDGAHYGQEWARLQSLGEPAYFFALGTSHGDSDEAYAGS